MMPRTNAARRESYFSQSREPLTAFVAVLPLFAAYQVGILLTGGVRNGVDFVSSILMSLFGGDLAPYLALNAVVLLVFLVAVALLRRSGSIHPRLFPFMLLESALYAVMVGGVVNLLMNLTGVSSLLSVPPLRAAEASPGLIYKLVMSVGAGLYEELVFRLMLLGGLFWAMVRGGVGRVVAGVIAVVVSSLVFSGVHHLGSMGEAFTLGAFTFRFFAGVVFAALYQVRGFAIAAWTHALYDIWVMVFLGVD